MSEILHPEVASRKSEAPKAPAFLVPKILQYGAMALSLIAGACNKGKDDTGATTDSNPVEDVGVTHDADGDGFTVEGGSSSDPDCDDTNPSINPNAQETCNGFDDDCDGATDESDAADAETFYKDEDGDGYGDLAKPVQACEQPRNTTTLDLATDCKDSEAAVNPGAEETCNEVDDDCDGTTDEGTTAYDDDGDGYTEAAGDCNDASASVYPGATETANGTDDDCDGTIDEGTLAYDDDGDGYTEAAGDCNDASASVYPGATEVWYDGIDQDCDGESDYDADFDGDDAIAYGGGDCDDSDGDVSSLETEGDACDGKDSDCDGEEVISVTVDSVTTTYLCSEVFQAEAGYNYGDTGWMDQDGDGTAETYFAGRSIVSLTNLCVENLGYDGASIGALMDTWTSTIGPCEYPNGVECDYTLQTMNLEGYPYATYSPNFMGNMSVNTDETINVAALDAEGDDNPDVRARFQCVTEVL